MLKAKALQASFRSLEYQAPTEVKSDVDAWIHQSIPDCDLTQYKEDDAAATGVSTLPTPDTRQPHVADSDWYNLPAVPMNPKYQSINATLTQQGPLVNLTSPVKASTSSGQ